MKIIRWWGLAVFFSLFLLMKVLITKPEYAQPATAASCPYTNISAATILVLPNNDW